MRVFEKLIQERNEAWEERKELLIKIKRTDDITERDKLFKRFMDLGFKVKEIQDKIKLRLSKHTEAEIRKDGVSIKTFEQYGHVVVPFEDFDRIVRWYQELVKEVEE